MGREVRRVPLDWQHPRYTKEDARYTNHIGMYRPLYEESFREAADKWEANYATWLAGTHPDIEFREKYRFWEWDTPPRRDSYRDREWTEAEATAFQLYEDVTEGTPVSPVFATAAELVDWLCEAGDEWDRKRGSRPWDRQQAERIVAGGWAPSMVVVSGSDGVTIQRPGDPEI